MESVTRNSRPQTGQIRSETPAEVAKRAAMVYLASLPQALRLSILHDLTAEARAGDPEPPPFVEPSPPRDSFTHRPMTRRQRAILDWLRGFIVENGFPPTVREIGRAFGIRSTNGVNDHLCALERRGLIQRCPMMSRGIRLVNR